MRGQEEEEEEEEASEHRSGEVTIDKCTSWSMLLQCLCPLNLQGDN